MNRKKLLTRSSRRAVSPVVATILLVSATHAVGLAVGIWARGDNTSILNSLQNGFSSNSNGYKEMFVLANANFTSSKPQNVTLWFYNNGNSTVYIKSLTISNITVPSESWSNYTTNLSRTNIAGCGYCLQLSPHTPTPVMFKVNTSFKSGVTYQFKAVGEYGTSEVYTQTR